MSGQDEANALLRQGGALVAKFDTPGDTCSGVITAIEVEQERTFKTNVPRTFSDGNPIMQIVVTVQTENVTEEDDGLRRLFVKGTKTRPTTAGAVSEALKAADAELAIGGSLSLTYSGDGVAQGGNRAPKNYTAEYLPPGP